MSGCVCVPLLCPQTKAVSDHYPIELRLQGTVLAKGRDNDDDNNSWAARTVSLSFVVVLSVAMATIRLLM